MLVGVGFRTGGKVGIARGRGVRFALALGFESEAALFGLVGEKVVARVLPDRADRGVYREPEQPGDDREGDELADPRRPFFGEARGQGFSEALDKKRAEQRN